jgi:hypothetical protein
MRKQIKIFWLILLGGISTMTFGQGSPQFAITRNVIAGGGTTASTSSRFRLDSTVAQPLAAVPSSARFSIQGGFWIVPAPIIFGPTVAGTNFLVSIQSELGKTYTVQYLNALGSGWQSLPPVNGTGGIITLTNGGTGVGQRFFRLLQQ